MNRWITLMLLTGLSVPVSAQSISIALMQKFRVPLKGGKPTRIVSNTIHYRTLAITQSRSISIYNRDGMLTSREFYYKDGELTGKQEYIIDTSRKLVLARIVDGPFIYKKIRDTLFYTYDQQGFIVRQENRSDGLSTTVVFNNDENGFPLTAQAFDTLGNLETNEKAVYQHDKNYYIVTMHSKEGKLKLCDTIKIDFRKPFGRNKTKEKYNQFGDRISYRVNNKNVNYIRVEIEYEYDAQGNWTSMKRYNIVKSRAGTEIRRLDEYTIFDITYEE